MNRSNIELFRVRTVSNFLHLGATQSGLRIFYGQGSNERPILFFVDGKAVCLLVPYILLETRMCTSSSRGHVEGGDGVALSGPRSNERPCFGTAGELSAALRVAVQNGRSVSICFKTFQNRFNGLSIGNSCELCVTAVRVNIQYCGSTMERSGMGCSSLICRALASAAWPPGSLPTTTTLQS